MEDIKKSCNKFLPHPSKVPFSCFIGLERSSGHHLRHKIFTKLLITVENNKYKIIYISLLYLVPSSCSPNSIKDSKAQTIKDVVLSACRSFNTLYADEHSFSGLWGNFPKMLSMFPTNFMFLLAVTL